MKKMISLLAVSVWVFALAPAAQATPVPPFGYAGDYRIMFTTTTTWTNTVGLTDIATYNARVEAVATNTSGNAIDLSGISPWKIVGSTATVSAKTNTSTHSTGDANDVPIYNVNGERIWNDNAHLWGTTAADPMQAHILDETGAHRHSRIWTGTHMDGLSWTDSALGDDTPIDGNGQYIYYGNPGWTIDGRWISWSGDGAHEHANNGKLPYYALSPVITAVAPTGATIVVSGSSTIIHPGDSTPDLADDTDFGSIGMGGGATSKTYTVSNFGTVDTLTLSDPATVTGGGGRFAVGALTATVLPPGAAATFTVTYTAHSGARSVDDATVSVASDANDNDPYTFAITATTLNDGVITDAGGYPGVYRIAFVTTGKTLAQATTIDFYNTFVSDAAAAVSELDDLGVEWKCLGSTSNTSAKVNTSTDSTGDANDVPIYTTTGQLIATNNADLWDGTIQNPIFFDNGTVAGVAGEAQEQAWTGTDADGSSASDTVNGGSYLGSGPNGDNTSIYMRLVRGGYTDGNWISGPSDHDLQSKHLLALSGLLNLPPAGSVLIVR